MTDGTSPSSSGVYCTYYYVWFTTLEYVGYVSRSKPIVYRTEILEARRKAAKKKEIKLKDTAMVVRRRRRANHHRPREGVDSSALADNSSDTTYASKANNSRRIKNMSLSSLIGRFLLKIGVYVVLLYGFKKYNPFYYKIVRFVLAISLPEKA